jgi:apolipoprotein N-acyltransferase
LLALTSGLLLASLGYGQPMLAWIAFVPLLAAVAGRRLRTAAGLALLAGWIFEAGTTSWMLQSGVSLPAHALLTFLCALRFAAWGALAALPLGPWRLLVLPGAFVLLEYLRLHQGPFSAPWGLIGYSQASFLPAARLAAWGGVYGVSLAILAVNVALVEVARRSARPALPGASRLRARAPALAVLVLTGGLVASQSAAPRVLAAPAGRELQVVAVQGGYHQRGSAGQLERMQGVERYRRLSRAAVSAETDLVVWPEASFPAAIPADASALRAASAIAGELGAPLLLASSGADKDRRAAAGRAAANSAFLVDPSGGIRARYDKVRLLPFNEYVPLRAAVDWPDWIAADLADAVPGRTWSRFELDGYRFAVLICWENLFPHDFRAASEGADFVVSLTNEAFTESPVAHQQMLDMNRFRAIESGVWIVRAATTAASAGIAPSGELVAQVREAGAGAFGAFSLDFAPGASPTLYRRFGDWIVALLALLLAAVAAGGLGRRVRAWR